MTSTIQASSKTALKYRIPMITTLSGAHAAAEGIAALQGERLRVRPLRELMTAVILLEF